VVVGPREGRSVHATAYCPRYVDPSPSACLSRLSLNLCCADKGPRQGVHAPAHPYTPTGKTRGLRGAFLSTIQTGTGTGSAGGRGKEYAVGFQIVGGVLGVATFTAVAVHTFDTNKAATEIAQAKAYVARVEDKAAMEIAQAKSEVARIEGDRILSDQFWKAELERYKHDLDLAHTKNYEPYQTAISKNKKKKGGTGGPQREEETD